MIRQILRLRISRNRCLAGRFVVHRHIYGGLRNRLWFTAKSVEPFTSLTSIINGLTAAIAPRDLLSCRFPLSPCPMAASVTVAAVAGPDCEGGNLPKLLMVTTFPFASARLYILYLCRQRNGDAPRGGVPVQFRS